MLGTKHRIESDAAIHLGLARQDRQQINLRAVRLGPGADQVMASAWPDRMAKCE